MVLQTIEPYMQGCAEDHDLETQMKKRSVKKEICEAGCTTIAEEKK